MSKLFKGVVRATSIAGLVLVGFQGIQTVSANLNGQKNPVIVSVAGGTNTGGSDRASAIFQQWCRSADAALDDAQTDAKLAILAGDYATAKTDLIGGLVTALREKQDETNPIDQTQSLTYRILTRGLEIASAIEDATQSDPMSLYNQVQILEQYYNFAEKTSLELDVPLYIPIQSARARNIIGQNFDQAAFERRYEQFAKDQIDWVIDAFVVRGSNSQTGDINILYTRGSDAAFFKVAELITSYAATDLQDSLFGLRYACVVENLQRLNVRLARFNAGDHSALGDARIGLNTIVYPKLVEYSNSIQGGCGTR